MLRPSTSASVYPMAKVRPRSLTGIQPSGIVHLGNYLGMIKPALARQSEYDCIYFIADLHALTTNRNPENLKTWIYDLVAAWVTCGLDVDQHILFRQSDVAMVTEFAWYLSCVTGLGLLEKAHATKDARDKGKDLTHATFAYPVLMAADILMYDTDIVPVGKDQKQHVEMARDMAGSFNASYGAEVIKLPEPSIAEQTMIVPGLDGQKMSKSYGNTLPLFCTEKELRKRVMSIATDSTPLEAPKSMRNSLLEQYFILFGSKDLADTVEQRLNAGGLGWGHVKDELAQLIFKQIQPLQEPYTKLRADEKKLDQLLAKGAEKAHALALPVLERVRKAVGTGL